MGQIADVFAFSRGNRVLRDDDESRGREPLILEPGAKDGEGTMRGLVGGESDVLFLVFVAHRINWKQPTLTLPL